MNRMQKLGGKGGLGLPGLLKGEGAARLLVELSRGQGEIVTSCVRA